MNMPAQTQGSLLKATREARGLTLEMAHEVTKIPMDALRAIEDGYSVRSVSPFYLKGFIKMYAEYLGVNIQDVLEDYKKEELPKAARLGVEEFDLGQWVGRIFTRQRKQQMVVLAGILLCFFLLFKIITFFTHRRPARTLSQIHRVEKVIKPPKTKTPPVAEKTVQARKKEPPQTPAPKAEKTEKQETDVVALKKIRLDEIVDNKKAAKSAPAVPQPLQDIPSQTVYTAGQAVETAKPQSSKTITLTARAKKDSWLRVKADNALVFQSTLNRGSAETWTANEKIEISGKNIGQLEFELNGKLIGSLGRKDLGAKKIIVTPSGLSADQ